MAQTSAEKARKYRLANPEKCAEAHRRWRARNIDAIRMRARLAARGINKEKLRARAERVRKDNLRITNEIKMKNGCEACGYREHPAALHFDHIDRTTKRTNVGNMVNGAYNIKDIMEEVSKCRVLCANCHAIKTVNNGDLMWRNRRCNLSLPKKQNSQMSLF